MRKETFITDWLAAWNTRDPQMVADFYADTFVYLDPNTKGEIRDKDAFIRYLTKLLAAWDMTWYAKQAHRLQDIDGWALLWRAIIKKEDGSDQFVELHGMDIVVLDGDRICRNEVYFDRTKLAP